MFKVYVVINNHKGNVHNVAVAFSMDDAKAEAQRHANYSNYDGADYMEWRTDIYGNETAIPPGDPYGVDYTIETFEIETHNKDMLYRM